MSFAEIARRLFRRAVTSRGPIQRTESAKLNLNQLEDRTVPASISGSAFYDVNNNGSWNAPEAGAAGVQISLLPSAGSPVTTTSDSAGSYAFMALSMGSGKRQWLGQWQWQQHALAGEYDCRHSRCECWRRDSARCKR